MKHETQPSFHHLGSKLGRLALAGLLALLGATAAQAQPTISIDFQGPSGLPLGGPLDPGGAYLASPAPVPPVPAVIYNSAALGITPVIFGIGELDALSWGQDTQLRPNSTFTGLRTFYRLMLSTDEFAIGDPGLGAPNDLLSEGAGGNQEASADVQVAPLSPFLPLPPLAPGAAFISHYSWLDGDGVAPFGGLGIGLVEANPPVAGLPDAGDNLDAFDFRRPASSFSRLYFSVDASWMDPIEGFPANAGTDAGNGVLPGDILASNGLGGFFVWASAFQLGLSPDDDLDALILWENGDGVFTPSVAPFDWILGGTDMLLFSVRRGSPLIGTLDAFFNVRISEGDILTTPPGGPAGQPGIFIAAEVLGLATTRSGTAAAFSDDLNAASIR